jgi:hypothetical protein
MDSQARAWEPANSTHSRETDMSEVEELETKVKNLSTEELAQFREWFLKFANERLNTDVRAAFGLLKAPKSASLEDFEAAIADGPDSTDD